MNLAWVLSIYFVTWWLVLFAILPIGIRSHEEAGIEHVPGCDPGAPFQPRLRRKFVTTTWVSALLVGALWLAFFFNLVQVPTLPGA